MNLKPTQNTAFCALLLAAIAAIPTQAFADSPLAKLYSTDSAAAPGARNSDRFPRARYEKPSGSKVHSFVWGDMQLDVRPGETIQCSVAVTNAEETGCFYSSSTTNFTTLTPDSPSNYFTSGKKEKKYVGNPDAVKVGWRATYLNSLGAASKLNEAFAHLDLSETNIGVEEAKGGRLWAYVWDFNTSWREDSTGYGKVGNVGKENFLNTSFFARLPNGHPIEIKLDKVSGDAFSVAGYYNLDEATEGINQSPKWDYDNWSLFSSTADYLYSQTLSRNFFSVQSITSFNWTGFITKYLGQGPCDADNWGEPNEAFLNYQKPGMHSPYDFYYSGDIKQNDSSNSNVPDFAKGAYDNYARMCIEQYTDKLESGLGSHVKVAHVPLYLEIPQFTKRPHRSLNNVTVTPSTTAAGSSATCVFPLVEKGTSTTLNIEGLGAGVGKAKLVCENEQASKDKIFELFSVSNEGKASSNITLANTGKYNCYVERVNQFDVAFADAEQVGAMRMYEVLPTGERIPLKLNWNDSHISKGSVLPLFDSNDSSPLQTKDAFRLPGNKQSPVTGSFLSSSYNPKADIHCADGEDINARCWGEYAPDTPIKIDNKKFGIGNGDIVNTWTYYPVSERFPFTIIVLEPADYREANNKYLKNGCFDGSVDPATGKPSDKYKPTYTPDEGESDGIPDVVEGRPGIKVFNPAKGEDSEIPGPNTDGDKNKDGSEKPDYDDRDSDGDGIPDKIECHFDPSHTGYGYVNGCEDTDHDGIPDYRDTDSDNDGIPDNIECIWIQTNATNYIDGCIVSDPGVPYIPDFKNPAVKGGPQPGDGDTDGDGIPDKVENKGADPSKAADKNGGQVQPGYDKDGNVDTDNDGIPDYKDTDSDNDGIPDKVECPDYATAGKCRNSDASGTPGVTNPDEVPDYKDTDSDGDDTPDNVECIYDASNNGLDYIEGCIVTTGDNIPDYRNPNKKQGTDISPNDGLPDRIQDPSGDSDGDGIPDGVECPEYKDKTTPRVGPIVNGCPDTDGDGVPDYKDTDSDNDGIPDKVENHGADPNKKGQPGYDKYGNVDTDGDGLPDYKDTDSDGDGIPDKVENTEDANHTKNSQGVVDTDGDGIPDYKEKDSDKDGIPDKDECHYDSSIKSTATEKYVNGCISTESPNNVPDYRNNNAKGDDTDHDGIPDRVEKGPDPSKPRETTPGKQDYDNKDSDGDGIPDKFECPNWSPLNVGDHYVDGCPDSDGDGKPDYRDTDSNNDGTPDNEQCQYDATSNQCKVGTPTGFGKGGYRHKENTLPPVPGGGGNGGNGNNGPNGGDSSFGGIIAGGCGCAAAGGSAPLSSGLVSLLLTALGIFGIRRRRNDA